MILTVFSEKECSKKFNIIVEPVTRLPFGTSTQISTGVSALYLPDTVPGGGRYFGAFVVRNTKVRKVIGPPDPDSILQMPKYSRPYLPKTVLGARWKKPTMDPLFRSTQPLRWSSTSLWPGKLRSGFSSAFVEGPQNEGVDTYFGFFEK